MSVDNVLNEGDGNINKIIIYEEKNKGEMEEEEDLGEDIMRIWVKVGGVIKGENGVGIEKREMMKEMLKEKDIEKKMRVKCDLEEKNLMKKGKVFKKLRRWEEMGSMNVRRGEMELKDIKSFWNVVMKMRDENIMKKKEEEGVMEMVKEELER